MKLSVIFASALPDDKTFKMFNPFDDIFVREFHDALEALNVSDGFNMPKIITVTVELPTIDATFTDNKVFWLTVSKLLMLNLNKATLVCSCAIVFEVPTKKFAELQDAVLLLDPA